MIQDWEWVLKDGGVFKSVHSGTYFHIVLFFRHCKHFFCVDRQSNPTKVLYFQLKSCVNRASEEQDITCLLTYWSNCCLFFFQTAEQAFRQIQNIVNFGTNVMSSLLGEKFVHSGVSVHTCLILSLIAFELFQVWSKHYSQSHNKQIWFSNSALFISL